MKLVLDLETIPSQRLDVLQRIHADAEKETKQIKAPSNYKDEAKIVEYITQKSNEILDGVDDTWRKTSFDGGYGHICVIGFMIQGSNPIALYKEGDDHVANEIGIIKSFYEILQDAYIPNEGLVKLIGHNLVNFDLRFLYQRSIVLGIKPPSFITFDAKPWSENVFDTMIKWAGVGNRVSLNKLADILGVGQKGIEGEEFDGSMVWDAVKNGEIAKVAEYCKQDVRLTADIYNRLNFNG